MIFIKINQCSVIRYGINHDFSFKELFDWNWKIGKDEDIGKYEKLNGKDGEIEKLEEII